MSNGEKFREKEIYRKKIVEMVWKIESLWLLEEILKMIKNALKED